MNKLFGLIGGICLLVCVLGCGRLGGTTADPGPANSANAQPEKVKMAVDVPSLIGKSVDEVKKTLGPPKSELAGSYTWEFPQGELSLQTRDKARSKVHTYVFTAKMVVVGNQVGQGYSTYDKMGDLIGFDTRGKTPANTVDGDTGNVRFEKVNLNGKNVDEISFQKVSGTFNAVYVTPERGY